MTKITNYWNPAMQNAQSFKIPVGISQCLMGEKVRYNGDHKRSSFCMNILGDYFDYTPVCPEVGAGMSIPRPPIHLVKNGEHAVKVLGSNDHSLDVTEALETFSQRTVEGLSHLCGYILMQKSPSCGMERIAVYNDAGNPVHHKGQGVFARALMERYPLLPVEEAGRLNDAGLRENFIARVYAYHRWMHIKDSLTAKDLIDFYSDYKYLVMAHDPQAYHSIGRVLSDLSGQQLQSKAEEFIQLLMDTLKRPATRRTNTNVLMHIQGYFKKQLDSSEKQELCDIIEQYRKGDVPLVAPLVLLKHHLRRHPDDYLNRQAFIRPYPDELRLRNSV